MRHIPALQCVHSGTFNYCCVGCQRWHCGVPGDAQFTFAPFFRNRTRCQETPLYLLCLSTQQQGLPTSKAGDYRIQSGPAGFGGPDYCSLLTTVCPVWCRLRDCLRGTSQANEIHLKHYTAFNGFIQFCLSKIFVLYKNCHF